MKITNIEGSNGVIGSCCVVHFLSVDSKSAEFDKIIKLRPAKIDGKEKESKISHLFVEKYQANQAIFRCLFVPQ